MDRVIIHIGFPRTATSWFQQCYFSKVENYSFISRKIILEEFLHPSVFDFKKQKLVNDPRFRGNLIISDEMISGRIRAGLINHLFFKEYTTRFKDVFPNAEFVVFIRNQKNLIWSMYQLYIEKGGTYSINNFLSEKNHLRKLFLYDSEALNYYKYLTFLEKLVGREKIHIYLYEDFASNNLKFLEKFGNTFNFEVPDSEINFNPVNFSIGNKGVSFRRIINHFTRYGIPFKHYYFHIPFLYPYPFRNMNRLRRVDNNDIPVKISDECNKLRISNKMLIDYFQLIDLYKYNYP